MKKDMSTNRRLAEILGWTEIFDVGGALLGNPPLGEPEGRGQARVPDWTGDWSYCGPLLIAHINSLDIAQCFVSVSGPKGFDLTVSARAAQTKDEAARDVIVRGVIAKLEGRL